jgi:uncharacterized protein (DUF697 family)
MTAEPGFGEGCDAQMNQHSAMFGTAAARSCDWSSVRHAIDVGGGRVLVVLLSEHPHGAPQPTPRGRAGKYRKPACTGQGRRRWRERLRADDTPRKHTLFLTQTKTLGENLMSTPEPETSLEDKLTATARAERLARAHSLAQNYVLASAGIALVPLPLVDLVGLMALQVKLVHGLAKHYDVPFKENIARSLLASLLSGASSTLLFRGLASLAKAVPVLGTLAGGGGIAVSSASVTYAVGEVFIQHFESGGTLLNFDADKLKGLFRRKLKTAPAEASPAIAAETAGEPPADAPLAPAAP